jgi:hypothetical protein
MDEPESPPGIIPPSQEVAPAGRNKWIRGALNLAGGSFPLAGGLFSAAAGVYRLIR